MSALGQPFVVFAGTGYCDRHHHEIDFVTNGEQGYAWMDGGTDAGQMSRKGTLFTMACKQQVQGETCDGEVTFDISDDGWTGDAPLVALMRYATPVESD